MNDLGKRIAALRPEQREALLAKLKARAGAARPPALERRAADAYPASSAQQRLWFLQALAPESRAYVGSTALALTGALDTDSLRRALGEIVRRHEVLRSRFEERDGDVWQVVEPAKAFELPVLTPEPLPHAERRSAAERLIEELSSQPFDLGIGPLLRAAIVELDPEHRIFLLTAHHIVADGWSLEQMTAELSALYTAFAAGHASPLAELPVQYGDFAVWERARLRDASLEQELDYWKQALADVTPLALAEDGPRRGPSGASGGCAGCTVPDALAERLRDLARETRSTLFMTLLAAFETLLFRATGQTDLVVGTVVANRQRPELEPLIGLVANLVPLRVRLEPSISFRDLAARIREVTLGAFEHQAVPFQKIVEAVRPDRDPHHTPLVSAAFAVQTSSLASLVLPGIEVEVLPLREETSRFDLEVHVWDRGAGLHIDAAYSRELFDETAIARLLDRYVHVLETVAAKPDMALSEVQLLTPSERGRVIAGGTGVVGGPRETRPLGDVFRARAEHAPEAIAIEDAAGARWTYRELSERAGRIARVLHGEGVGPNVRVGVWLERDARLFAAIVGVTMAGGAYVPIEPSQPASRAAAMFRDAGVRVVLTSEGLASTVPSGPWTIATLEAAEGVPEGPFTAEAGHIDDLAYVLFTSGSTGNPKGVAVSQRAVLGLVTAPDYVTLGAETVMGQAATAAFDAATFELWGALVHGGRLVVLPPSIVLSPTMLGQEIGRRGITTMFLTTALVHQIGRETPGALNALDTLIFGGEVLDPRRIAAIREAGGPRRLVHAYGPTEATTFATCWQVTKVAADARTVPIGGPIVDTTAWVLDSTGALAPVGTTGELFLGGPRLAGGYVGQPRLTAEKFVPDGVSGASGARLYRTGDRVRWIEPGVIDYVGRRDGQIKLRGFRIEIGEVEGVLGRIAGVASHAAAVVGDGEARELVAWVVPASGETIDERFVRETLKRELPSYMVPSRVIVAESLPLNANGKLDRAALARPLPPARTENALAAPRGDIEQAIAGVWRTVLERDAIGTDENFFDVGGHSLLLVRVQAGLERAIGHRVPLIALFEHPTIAALAAHLRGDAESGGVEAKSAPTRAAGDHIAIIGMAGRFPGSPDVETFWKNLEAGVEGITRFTPDELRAAGVPDALLADPHYVPARGVIADIDRFDAGLFGFTAREAASIDPQQRVLMECAWTALESAGYAPGEPHETRVGVYVGSTENTYTRPRLGHEAVSGAGDALEALLANGRDFLATRVSYKLQLTGPAVTVQSACSTSLVAVHAACQALRAGECEVAMAGGVSVTVPAVAGYRFQPEGIVSPDGHCRAFDARAAGTVAGQGVGVVILKPLAAALADGDTIRAVIRGSSINNDGASKIGFTAPSVAGQAAVIRAAQRAAGVTPDTIGYVEAHGTGTSLGDPIELRALVQVWGGDAIPESCALGSVKTNVGHLDAAAGVAGLIKTVLALEHQAIPPSLHFEAPSPEAPLGPFRVPTKTAPWLPLPGVPRRAGVSSFGMGGTNAHVIVEEAPAAAAAPARERAWHVVPISGREPAAVEQAARQLATHLETHPDLTLADVAYTQQVGRAALGVRAAVVGRDAASIAPSLARVSPSTVPAGTRPLVWIFPGQGTQAVNMARALDESEPVFRAELDACALAVRDMLGADLRLILYPAPGAESDAAARLEDTLWTQVAIVAVELALAALWRSWGLAPDVVLGHSVGEIAAACVAGVLSRDDAMRLAAVRGRAMREARPGGMTAVAAPARDVEARLGDGLSLAAVNGTAQAVVSGTREALARFEAGLAGDRVAYQRLPAAGAFHSPLMAESAIAITAHAASCDRHAPSVSWISTVTGSVLTADEATSAEYWGRQVTAPVQWVAAMAAARLAAGATAVWLEVGPGRTLTGLVRGGASDGEAHVASIDEPDAAEAFARAQARLWTAGIAVDWTAGHRGMGRRRVPLPTYPFQRQRYWIEPELSAEPKNTDALVKRTDVERWFYTPGWRRAPLDALRDPATVGTVVVFADAAGLGDRLAADLTRRGIDVIHVEAGAEWRRIDRSRYAIDPARQDHYERLLSELAAEGVHPRRLIHTWHLAPSGDAAAFMTVLYLAQALAARREASPVDLFVATDCAADVIGAETLRPIQAAAGGLCRVIPQEHAEIHCRTVDVDRAVSSDAQVAADLAGEVVGDASDVAVAYRHGHRWVEHAAATPRRAPAKLPRRLREEGAYLITGGTGHVGLAIAEYLVRAARARVILLGRSADAADPRVRQLGSSVSVVTGDVADAETVGRAIAEAQTRFGALHGIVHAAGLTSGDAFVPIRGLDRDGVARQWRAKWHGTRALADAVAGLPLDFCLLTSSISTVLGGLGFGAYASANAAMSAFAAVKTRQGSTPWISVAFDGWRFGEGDRSHTAELAMTQAEGVDVVSRVLDCVSAAPVIVSTADLHARIRTWVQPVSAPTAAAPSAASAHVRQVPAGFRAPETETERLVAAVWEELIGVAPIGLDDDFFALGGHSLLGTQIVSRVRQSCRVSVSLADLFAEPTIGGLGRLVDARRVQAPPAASDIVERVRSLSAAERSRLLEEARRAAEPRR